MYLKASFRHNSAISDIAAYWIIERFEIEEVDQKGNSIKIKKSYLDSAVYAPDLA